MENILAKNAQVKCPNLFVIIVCVHPAVWLHMLHVAQRTTLWSWLSSYTGGNQTWVLRLAWQVSLIT